MIALTGFIKIQAQDLLGYKGAVSISTDNDVFVYGRDFDRFYSFGAGVQYDFKSEKLLGLERLFDNKKGYFFGIGARIEGYTSSNAEIYSRTTVLEDNDDFDRPWAGLLFASLDATYLFERSFFKTGLLLGVMGPSSQAGALQMYWHEDISNDLTYEGWQFQIPDQAIVNLSALYAYDLTPKLKPFDVFAKVGVQLGNLYINAAPTIGLRFGEFQNITKSIGTGNDIMISRKSTEFFFQSTFGASINAFNGTAQGNLFDPENGFAVDKLNTVHTTMSHGIYFTSGVISLSANYIFSYGEVLQGEKHIYARFAGSFRF